MPFTVSHVAAILPFTARRTRHWFDAAALTIGAMAPDLPLFWPGVLSYSWSHDFVFGPLIYDLALGLVVFMIWSVVLRRPLTDLAPKPLRGRLPADRAFAAIRWPMVVWSISLGAYTHVLWDTFTHANRLGSLWIPALDSMIGPLPVFKWLQYGSGLCGLAGLACWLILWWRRTPPQALKTTASMTFRHLSWAAVGGTSVVAVAVVGAVGSAAGLTLERTVFLAVTRSGAAVMVSLLVCCIGWWILARQRRNPSDSHLPYDRELRGSSASKGSL